MRDCSHASISSFSRCRASSVLIFLVSCDLLFGYIDGPRYGRRVRSHTCFSGLAAADAFSPVLVLLPEGRLRKTQTAVSDTQEGQQRQHGCHQSKHCNQQPDEVCPNSPVIKIALEQKREFSHDVIFRESEGIDVDVL